MHVWGDAGAPLVVCLHGVQAHGGRFRRLAEERLVPAGFRVLAPDLRGHGRSGWDPPWNLETHVRDVVDVVAAASEEPVRWIGHSFGGRLVLEILLRAPERAAATVLLDPVLELSPADALWLAEEERADRVFASPAAARAWRRQDAPEAPEATLDEELRDHLVRGGDGFLRFRYSQSAVVAMYGELAAPNPAGSTPSVATGAQVPPLLVALGARSALVGEYDLEGLRRCFGTSLEVVTVPAGHMILWEAFDETADAVMRFLDP